MLPGMDTDIFDMLDVAELATRDVVRRVCRRMNLTRVEREDKSRLSTAEFHRWHQLYPMVVARWESKARSQRAPLNLCYSH